MKKRMYLALASVMMTLGVGAQVVEVNPAITYQTIADFGASDCWTAEYVGKYFNESEKAKAAKWLFSQNMDANGNPEGIGLSCWRVNIGAGSAAQGSGSNIEDETRRAECFLKEDGSYDWTRQAGQLYFMGEAKKYGVDNFLLFSNSAPVYFTKNGKANANGQSISCNLKDDCYDDFAEFLATTTEHFIGEGYNVTFIDPVNEPQFDWKDGQEGSPWLNYNIAKLAKELDKSIEKRNLKARILIPEASSLDCLYGGSGRATKQINSFFNPSSSNYVGNLSNMAKTVAGHSYWTYSTNETLVDVRKKVRDAAAEAGVDVMQTEWSMLGDAPDVSTGFPASYEAATKMDIALFMAKIIYTDLAVGNMTAWSYWTAMAQEKWSQKNRFYLIRLNANGDSGVESYGDIKKGGKVAADKNLWTLGNYSRFIRPGYKRVAVEGADDLNGLMCSAYISPDGKQTVCVFVNMSKEKRTVNLSLRNTETGSFKKYVTNITTNLKLDETDSQLSSISLTSRSVTTLVIDNAGDTAVGEIKADTRKGSDKVYDLRGITARNTPQGVYIYKGKATVFGEK